MNHQICGFFLPSNIVSLKWCMNLSLHVSVTGIYYIISHHSLFQFMYPNPFMAFKILSSNIVSLKWFMNLSLHVSVTGSNESECRNGVLNWSDWSQIFFLSGMRNFRSLTIMDGRFGIGNGDWIGYWDLEYGFRDWVCKWVWEMGIWIGDWGLGLQIGICNWGLGIRIVFGDLDLGLFLGIGDCDWGLRLGSIIGDRNWDWNWDSDWSYIGAWGLFD